MITFIYMYRNVDQLQANNLDIGNVSYIFGTSMLAEAQNKRFILIIDSP